MFVNLEIPLNCDEDGFLKDPDSWNITVARQLAQMEGIDELDSRQWEFIVSLRQYYFTFHKLPQIRRVCHMHQLDNNCASKLFNNHGIDAWRIAGLPNPGEEVKAYM